MGGIGSDFQPYRDWMKKQGLSEKYLVSIPEEHCAQAFITTDLDANQITAFHPGAMNHSHRIKVPANDGISMGVIAPDSREGMLQHAQQFKAANIPFIFDPGQAMPLFDGADFRQFIEMADWVAVNDYEWALLQERTGWQASDAREAGPPATGHVHRRLRWCTVGRAAGQGIRTCRVMYPLFSQNVLRLAT